MNGLFRVPTSAFRVWSVLALGGCNPATTRPAFLPLPEAPVAYLDVRPDRVTTELTEWLEAQGLQIARSHPRDGYVETWWYDPITRRSFRTERDVPNLVRSFRIRCWADPDVIGASRVSVEAVYRPRYDPSRTSRDLEVLAPEGHAGHDIAQRLIEEMQRKLGVPLERR
jgi:hypothetical protein